MLTSGSSNVTIRDLSIDYDPLPFTQGTIAGFDRAALRILVKVDPGYPDDPASLAAITDGYFKVMDRPNRAWKAGAGSFLSRNESSKHGRFDQNAAAVLWKRPLSELTANRGGRRGCDQHRTLPCGRGGRQRRHRLHRREIAGFACHGNTGKRSPGWNGATTCVCRSRVTTLGNRNESVDIHQLGRLSPSSRTSMARRWKIAPSKTPLMML